ncbi:DUF2290 domain-containing protein [Photobacterium damselae]|uniref:DUF2290 domain-containing protein n=1 Tax=Photobacterium damselae TaxID=38293 RepID=UPI00406804DA
MNSVSVYKQLNEVITRLVITSLSVSENRPSIKEDGIYVNIGNIKGISNSTALKNISYSDIYKDIFDHEGYHIKLVDGGLLIFQYQFEDYGNKLRKHRLSYFPSPDLPLHDEYPLLYENDELFLDIVKTNLVRFPIRFDFDPDNQKDEVHPASHVSFGQYENCRIPVSMPVTPRKFILFILRNFYHKAYIKHKNVFDKKMAPVTPHHTLTHKEKQIGHFIL